MQDPVFVKDAFAKIAGRYMLTNHVLSLGTDILWRRKVAKMVADKQSAAAPGKSLPGKAPAVDGPELQACKAKNQALDKEVDKMMADGKKAGNISPTEAAEFTRMERLIATKRLRLTQAGGFSLADCNLMTKSYEDEKAKVAKMAADKANVTTQPPRK